MSEWLSTNYNLLKLLCWVIQGNRFCFNFQSLSHVGELCLGINFGAKRYINNVWNKARGQAEGQGLIDTARS